MRQQENSYRIYETYRLQGGGYQFTRLHGVVTQPTTIYTTGFIYFKMEFLADFLLPSQHPHDDESVSLFVVYRRVKHGKSVIFSSKQGL
jgi:hypothetical protein